MSGEVLNEVRCGGRNFIRPGDLVHVKPSRKGKRDGGPATVRKIVQHAEYVEVEVAMGAPPKPEVKAPRPVRTFMLSRIERRQPKP